VSETEGEAGGVDSAELELKLRARLRVNPEALDEEFTQCPTDVAYLGGVHARAIGEHLRAKGKAKRIRGLVFIQKRQELVDKHGKATEEHIKAAVEQDPRVLLADGEEIDAEVAREKAKADFAAVMAKKDMLVQLGATYRAEMERDPSIARDRREGRAARGSGRAPAERWGGG
jgi:hypothetical protein